MTLHPDHEDDDEDDFVLMSDSRTVSQFDDVES